jgi:2-desacetyl-2-hydroxyethyl bacteriochlorophyllide A dehydrogenase
MVFVTQPETVEIWERPLPSLGELDVLIKVKATALCGSDLHIFKGKHPAVSLPIPVGHEIAGEVAEVGARVTKVKPGDRVAVEPVIVCGECHYCQRGDYHLCANISFQYRQGQGGLTTDFVTSERWVHLLPESISYAAGALIEPLSVAVHAVRLVHLNMSESVAVFGAGAIGLFILQVARAVGAGDIFISDIRESRLSAALDFGASSAFNSLKCNPVEEIFKQTDGIGVQRAFEAVGLEITLNQALQTLQKGGEAVLVGLFEEQRVALPANIFVQKEISLVGSQGYQWDFQRAIELIQQGKIDLEEMITHKFHLEQIQKAFETLIKPAQEAVKVVISSE